jgi:phage shock protein PspC (stress-responsive transcriptional regulator)
LNSLLDGVRRLRVWRTDDRWLGGVAAGLAHRLGVDPLLVRGGFLVAGLLFGVGFLVYGLAWILLPEASDGRIHLDEATRGNVDAGLVGGVVMAVLGLTGAPAVWTWTGAWSGVFLVPSVVVAVVLGVWWASTHPSRPAAPAAPWTPPQSAAPAGPPSTGSAATASVSPPGTPEGGRTMPSPASPRVPPQWSGPTAPLPPVNSPAASGHGFPPPALGAGAGVPPGFFAAPPAPGGPPPVGGGAPGAPTPPRRSTRPRGAGSTIAGLMAAATLFILAGILLADRLGWAGRSWFAPGLAVSAILILTGCVIVGLGIAGRRAGGLTAFAIVVGALGMPVLLVADVALGLPGGMSVGEKTWRPVSAAEAADPHALSIGQSALDLTDLELDGRSVDVSYEFGVGEATVVVPKGVSVRVDAHVEIGAIDHALSDDWDTTWTVDRLSRRPEVPRLPRQRQPAIPAPPDSDEFTVYTDVWAEDVEAQDQRGGLDVKFEARSPGLAEGAEPRIEVTVDGVIGGLHIIEED